MAESTCRYCKQKIKQFFPVNWCHTDTMNVYCYPNAKEGTRESDLIATPPDEPINVYVVRKRVQVWTEYNELAGYCFDLVRAYKNEEDAMKYVNEHKNEDLDINEIDGEGF